MPSKIQMLLVLLLSGIHLPAWSVQKIYQIDSVRHEYTDVRNYFMVYHGDSALDDIRQVLQLSPDSYQLLTRESIRKINDYWLKFTLQNNTDKNLSLWLLVGGVDFYSYYSPADSLTPVNGGRQMPLKKLPAGEISRYAAPLTLTGRQVKTVYLHLWEGFLGPPSPFLMLVDRGRLARITGKESVNFWQGIFHGILWVMIVYNIFFTAIGKDKTYLFYALYMISISVYFLNITGYLQEFLFPENPVIQNYVLLIMQLGIIFYLTFIKRFLNLKKILPVWDRVCDYLIYATFILLIFKTAYFIIFRKFGIFLFVSQVAVIMGALLTLGLILALYRSRSILARYFMIGSIALGAGLLFSSLMSFSRIAFSPAYFSSIQTGIVFEILFFSIGLSYKISENEREKNKAQSQLIEQLQENDRLQTRYARDLEMRVDERTREISLQKEALEDQTRKLEQLNDEKNHLIGIVAHDLRNPLTSARSMISFLRENPGASEGDRSETVSIVSNSMERMNSMIDKILDIRAIESQTLNIVPEKLIVQELFNEITRSFSPKAESKSIRIIVSSEPISVHTDRHYLTEILENLVSNAIKFSPENTTIRLDGSRSGDKTVLSVSDEGPGFTAQDRKRLFLKYQRLSAVPTQGESSTGLGLSIVKKFMDALNGEIILESEEGKGSTFKLIFTDHR